MFARIWRTGLDETRASEYERFAAEQSLTMFRKRSGFRGALFLRTSDGRAVITLWQDQDAIEQLDESVEYRNTVAAIEATGFLRPPQSVEVLPLDGVGANMLPPSVDFTNPPVIDVTS